MEHNKWLEDNDFLNCIDFNDKYYLLALTKEISNYIKNAPVPMVTSWHKETKSINFLIGQNVKTRFSIDPEIAYKDFITKVEKWASKYYPQYEIEYEAEEDYSDNEYLNMVREEKISLDDALLRKKTIIKREKGIIERIYMREDSFLFNLDGEKSLRISGIPGQTILPLSKFLPALRKIKDDELIKEYIFSHSIESRKFKPKSKKEEISYSGYMMRNFFEINFDSLKNEELIKVDNRLWEWGDYIIKFESNLLENDCIEVAKSKGAKVIKQSEKENVYN
jgi:hypothetical protein